MIITRDDLSGFAYFWHQKGDPSRCASMTPEKITAIRERIPMVKLAMDAELMAAALKTAALDAIEKAMS